MASMASHPRGEPPRITFVALGRTFERLLNEPSLSQLVVSIKKKLSLDNASNIVLAQVRGDRRIDLEDEDDFAAFRAYAQSIGTAEVSIVLADPIQAQPECPAVQAESGLLTSNHEMKVQRKKKPKKPTTVPSTEQPVNAISEELNAFPTPLPFPSAETVNESNEISKQIEASSSVQPTSVVSAEKQPKRLQKQVSSDQEKKAKRRKNKANTHEEATVPGQAEPEASSTDPVPAKKKKTVNGIAEASQAPMQYTFVEEGFPHKRKVLPEETGSSQIAAHAEAESTERPKEKKSRRKKELATSSLAPIVAAVSSTSAEAQSEPQDLAPVAYLAAVEAQNHVSAQETSARPVTRKRPQDSNNLDQSDSVAAMKDTAIPRKRRKKEIEIKEAHDGEAVRGGKTSTTGANAEVSQPLTNGHTEAVQPQKTSQQAGKARKSKAKENARKTDITDQEADSALDEVLNNIRRRHKESTLSPPGEPGKVSEPKAQEQLHVETQVEQPAPPVALKEPIKEPRKRRTQKDKSSSDMPQIGDSHPSTSEIQIDREAADNTVGIAQATVSATNTRQPSAYKKKDGSRPDPAEVTASKDPPESESTGVKNPRRNISAVIVDDTTRRSSEHNVSQDKIMNPIIESSPKSILPFAPSGSVIDEVEIERSGESSDSDSDSKSGPESEDEAGDHLTAKVADVSEEHVDLTNTNEMTRRSAIPDSPGIDLMGVDEEIAEEILESISSDKPSRNDDDDTTAVQSRNSKHSSPEPVSDTRQEVDEPRPIDATDENEMDVDYVETASNSLPNVSPDAPSPALDALNAPTESVMSDGLANVALSEAMAEDDTSFLFNVHATDDVSSQQELNRRPVTPPRKTRSKQIGTPLSIQRMKNRHGIATGAMPSTTDSGQQEIDSDIPTGNNRAGRTRGATRRTTAASLKATEAKLDQDEEIEHDSDPKTSESKKKGGTSESFRGRTRATVTAKSATGRVTRAKVRAHVPEIDESLKKVADDIQKVSEAPNTSNSEGKREVTPIQGGDLQVIPESAMSKSTAKTAKPTQLKLKSASQPKVHTPRLSQISSQDLFSPRTKAQIGPDQLKGTRRSFLSNQDSDESSTSSSDSDTEKEGIIPEGKRAGGNKKKSRGSLATFPSIA